MQNVSPTDPTWHPPPPPADGYVSVFFNTFLNWPGCTDYTVCDVSDNSVGIVSNGLYLAQVDLNPLGINLKRWSCAPESNRVQWHGHYGLAGRGDAVHECSGAGHGSGRRSAGKAWVGFGAARGWAWENHDILSWTFGGPTPGTSFAGGLDEFSVYQRALSPCEVNAIFNAGSRGKYGTNVLVCPVATEVTLLTASGNQTFTFTNGLTWTNNGPHWETNTISFSTSTNPTPIVVRGLNPYNPADTNAPNNLNAVVDDFVLSALVTNTINGLLHFTENTNLAVLPIKFAPTPFLATNFPPVLIFSNDFSNATARALYQPAALSWAAPTAPPSGIRDWTVTTGPVTVVSNAFFGTLSTQWLAMATGAVQCLLPTTPGHRYQLSYNLRGPCAVGWWDGGVDPLSQRAQDLISGNNGAFINSATVSANGYVDARNVSDTLSFPGIPWPATNNPWYAFAPKIELGDPVNSTSPTPSPSKAGSTPFLLTQRYRGLRLPADLLPRRLAGLPAIPITWRCSSICPATIGTSIWSSMSKAQNSPGCGVSLVTTNHPITTNTLAPYRRRL